MLDEITVQVIGCFEAGVITVIAFTGVGMLDGGFTIELPTEMIPANLRMPNSEFIVVRDRQSGEFTQLFQKTNLNNI
ncbi:hypothetical protein GS682_03805 [Nostoc sp. B(2019)]|nr:hypothetical protein [Nostoc sp. B(2019)]